MRQAFKFQGKWRVKRLRADIRDVGVRKCRLNGGNALEHRSVISFRALGGLHLKRRLKHTDNAKSGAATRDM